MAGLTSVILVDLVTVSRIGFAMGRDGLLPQSIAKVNQRTGTPVRMTLLYAAVVLVLAAFVPLATLADLVSIGTLFAFVLVSIAVPVLRRTRPDMPRPFRVPFSPFVPVLSALACLYLMTNLTLETWLRFLAWLVLGLLFYAGYGYRHSRLTTAGARPAPPFPYPAEALPWGLRRGRGEQIRGTCGWADGPHVSRSPSPATARRAAVRLRRSAGRRRRPVPARGAGGR